LIGEGGEVKDPKKLIQSGWASYRPTVPTDASGAQHMLTTIMHGI
jgi:hypothetical protein